MQDKSSTRNIVYLSPQFLWFFSLAYTVVVVLANWFNAVQINFYETTMAASTLIYPITFLLINVITEVYGYKYARRAIWCGFLFTLIYFIYAQATCHMPNPCYANNNKIFDTLLSTHFDGFISLMIFYFTSETFTSYLVAKLKIILNGQYLLLRMMLSSLFAIFIGCGLHNFSIFLVETNFISLYEIFFMLLISIGCSPLLLYLITKLINSEKLDIYDTNTNFNLFSFDTEYLTIDNHIPLQRDTTG